MAWVLPPPNPTLKTRIGLVVFLVPARRPSTSCRSVWRVGVMCVASKKETGLLYGGLAVPLAIVCKSKANSA